ncbi:Taurine catabolism dioxygenase TauD, TfdA family [Roseomonas rosea]|uniref:Taurine catabolism dioxygenase TauD, TfdA family n=1 Tax=Muricoccus roseus TaxID=198092 RepID=A0A1M6KS28_9PROT|nr:TauD/TfdA family dioxygenase [Roseomonas rosea]SHJ61731.1 Taurine catabolism dioxygenase TauD, TfdA family [Roseomonas rosea]
MQTDLLQPIGGRAAWTGAEMARDPSWVFRFEPAAIAEIDAALAGIHQRGLPLPRIRAADFPLPSARPLLEAVSAELEEGRGLVRISGLPVERYAPDDLKTVFWGLCAHLGTPLPQNTAGEILAEVKDETGVGAAVTGPDASGAVPSARARSRSTGPLRFHTDKCDVLALLCASNGIAGGESRIVSTVAIHDALAERRPDLLEVLYGDFHRMRPADEEGEGHSDRVFTMPVFSRGPTGAFTSQYSRTYVEMAHAEPGVPPLRPEQIEAMDMLAAIADELSLQLPFEAGQIQLMNQHVTYHGRTAYADDAASGTSRVLMRIWLAAPNSRALPEGHAVQWGSTAPGAVRGGAMPGRSALAA